MASSTAPSKDRATIWPKYSSLISGVWKCVSYELHTIPSDPSQPPKIHAPHGPSPLGLVSITPSAYLSAHLANPSRFGPLPSGEPWQTAPDEEVAHVARGLSMYCGWLELFEDSEGLYWETRVEVSSDPNRKGGLEVRRVELREGEGGEGRRVMVLRPVRDMVMEVSLSCARSLWFGEREGQTCGARTPWSKLTLIVRIGRDED